jgi:hypothetical protein
MCSRFTRVNLLHIGILDVGRLNVTRERPRAGAFLQDSMDPTRSSRSAALPLIREVSYSYRNAIIGSTLVAFLAGI